MVVVSNPDGDELARAQLGPGETTSIITCEFEFTVACDEFLIRRSRYELIPPTSGADHAGALGSLSPS